MKMSLMSLMHFYKSFVRSIYSSYFFLILLVTHNKKMSKSKPTNRQRKQKTIQKKKKKDTSAYCTERERGTQRLLYMHTPIHSYMNTHTGTHRVGNGSDFLGDSACYHYAARNESSAIDFCTLSSTSVFITARFQNLSLFQPFP